MIRWTALNEGSSSSTKMSSALSGRVKSSKWADASFGFVTVSVGAWPTSTVVSTSPVARAVGHADDAGHVRVHLAQEEVAPGASNSAESMPPLLASS